LDRLSELAGLMRRRNALDREMAAILDRPAHPGHFGE
jgi:hypothetical protein